MKKFMIASVTVPGNDHMWGEGTIKERNCNGDVARPKKHCKS